MKETGNPYIEPENYFSPYQESLDKLKDNPEALALDKLCYLTFVSSAHGKKLLELFEERYIMPSLVPVGSPDYASLVTFYEGFKEAFRLIKMSIKSHEMRIKAESE